MIGMWLYITRILGYMTLVLISEILGLKDEYEWNQCHSWKAWLTLIVACNDNGEN